MSSHSYYVCAMLKHLALRCFTMSFLVSGSYFRGEKTTNHLQRQKLAVYTRSYYGIAQLLVLLNHLPHHTSSHLFESSWSSPLFTMLSLEMLS